MSRCHTTCLPALAAALLLATPVSAHIDTLTQVLAGSRVLKTFEAEVLPNVPAEAILEDARATGGRAVHAMIGKPVFALDLGTLDVGCYAVYLVGKVTDPSAYADGGRKPLYLKLAVNSEPDGRVSEHIESLDTSLPGNLIGFKVEGASMEPLVRDGQIMLALRDVRPSDGDLA